jgi:AcrR family transcriptional regulator
VDPALIYHYFGSKQQLFVASMEIPFDWSRAFPELLGGPPSHIGERLVRFMLGLWEDPEIQPRFMGLVRSAATDPEAAAMLRQLLTEGPVQGLAAAIGPPHGELRAMLAASHLMGLALLRYILRIEPLASADLDTLAALVGPRVTTYLVTDPAANGAAARD